MAAHWAGSYRIGDDWIKVLRPAVLLQHGRYHSIVYVWIQSTRLGCVDSSWPRGAIAASHGNGETNIWGPEKIVANTECVGILMAF